jgi:Cutinase
MQSFQRALAGLVALAVLPGLATVGAGSALGGTARSSSARIASAACSPVTFIGARGSGERIEKSSRGLGAAVNEMASAMEATLNLHGLPLATVADPYPADSVSDLIPTKDEAVAFAVTPLSLIPGAVALAVWKKSVDKYFASIKTGIADAITSMKQTLSTCPGTSLVLAGYSQGAMVMHQAELQLADAHETNLLEHIAGTLLLGDGDRAPNTKATEFGSSKHGEGIRSYFHGVAVHDVESPANTANICDEDDIVCEFDPKKLLKDHNPFAIVAAFKHAAAVHTAYATSESKPLKEAATWLAAKIISADTPPPPPPPPPPAPTPPPPPVQPAGVPSVGPTLVYDGDTAANFFDGDTGFEDWSNATGQSAALESSLPANLSTYRCVVLLLNESFADTDAAALSSYLQLGGTVLALGEHSGNPEFESADYAINGLASALGVGLSLDDDSIDEGDTFTTNIIPSAMTQGVSELGYNWASTETVSGAAQKLVETADGFSTLIGAQSVGPGTFITSGDSNLFTDNNDGFYADDGNGQFVANLCP